MVDFPELEDLETVPCSNSFSMLPAKPKIFYGREVELAHIMQNLMQQSPRIAILGGGGMGKTSIAKAILHHPEIIAKYEHRFFVACDTSNTSIELAAQIGLHIGVKSGQDSRKPVCRYFEGQPASLLILDNLETAWEPMQLRGGVEEFLSLLTEVEHLALMVHLF